MIHSKFQCNICFIYALTDCFPFDNPKLSPFHLPNPHKTQAQYTQIFVSTAIMAKTQQEDLINTCDFLTWLTRGSTPGEEVHVQNAYAICFGIS